jgi:hypothetical protein
VTSVEEPNQFHGFAADQFTDESVEQPVSTSGIAHNIKRSDFISHPFFIN